MTTTTKQETTTLAAVTIGEAGLFGLNVKIEKLNRRAKKLGMPEVTVTIVREFTLKHEKTGFDYPQYDVEINGCAPCINGWSLAAVIENDDTIGTMVKIVPGPFQDDDYSGYRDHGFGCDHCKTNRNRNSVYVLVNSEGFKRVIGRNCLTDYLNCDDASDFAAYAKFVDECKGYTSANLDELARDEGFGSRGGHPNVPLTTFLSAVQTCTRKIGWTSRSEAYDDPSRTATADDAYFLLFGDGEAHDKFVRDYELYASEGDADLAAKTVEWLQSLTPAQTEKSEYLDVLRKIGIAGETSGKLAGYTASAVRAYEKECAWKAEREEKAAGRKERVYTGSIGKAQDIGLVRVVGIHYIDGDYGTRSIVRMEQDVTPTTVAPIVWFASGSKEFEIGAEYNLRAGVKAQNDDPKYGKQTVITRAKLTAV